MPGSRENNLSAMSVSPYIKSGDSAFKIMMTFALVLVFICIHSIYTFGMHAALIIAVCIGTALLSEVLFRLLMKRKIRIKDCSSLITGLLVGMNVPPDLPVWVPATGTVFAVIIVKELFGGTGYNIFNPALSGRAFIMASWPVYMTSFRHISMPGGITFTSDTIPGEILDVITKATPLTVIKDGTRLAAEHNIPFDAIYDFLMKNNFLKMLAVGNSGGCIGEASALVLLAGALILLWRKIITWHIPFAFIGTVSLAFFTYYYFNGFTYAGKITLIQVFSGGLILGAFYMATDMVTSPLSPGGMLIFGMGCGLLTFIIRLAGGYPEGVCYAILIMNAMVPLIDRLTKPRISGYQVRM